MEENPLGFGHTAPTSGRPWLDIASEVMDMTQVP
jgi:hypothetical protein